MDDIGEKIQAIGCHYFEVYRNAVRAPLLEDLDRLEEQLRGRAEAEFAGEVSHAAVKNFSEVLRQIEHVRSEVAKEGTRLEKIALDGPSRL